MITKSKILSGINKNIIKFIVDPNMESGTVCQIGDSWFYFGGFTAEQMNPDRYLREIPIGDIVQDIFDVLDEFRFDEGFKLEYDYYDLILSRS